MGLVTVSVIHVSQCNDLCVCVCVYLQLAFMVSTAERVERNFEGFPHWIQIIHDSLTETETEKEHDP